MDKDLHDIEDLFRKGLQGNEELPPENTWERIDKILDKYKISIYKRYASLKRIVIILLWLLSDFVIYTINTKENNNQLGEKISKKFNKANKSNHILDEKEQVQSDSLNNNGIINLAKDRIPKKSIRPNKKDKTEKSIRPTIEIADNSISKNGLTYGTANSTKIILKNKSNSTTLRKPRFASGPSDKTESQNAGAINETASDSPEGENLKSHKITFPDGPGILFKEPLIFSSPDC